MRGKAFRIIGGVAALAAIATLAIAVSSGGQARPHLTATKSAHEEESARSSGRQATPGVGPADGYEAYLAAQRTYPANVIPPAIAARAEATFEGLAAKDAKTGDPGAKGHKWHLYGPKKDALEPGVISFTGATNSTASRITAIAVSPDCDAKHCRVWVGAAGGGVWRSDNVQADDPDWHQVRPNDLDQNSVGTLTLVGGDKKGEQTLYLGTGEANRCSSGCEAGVGIYKSSDGGDHWQKLADACVSSVTYACARPGNDAFLGRGINSIVVDPTNPNHLLVGSALGVRGLNHVIGAAGETQRFEPGANEPGLYESTDGGQTFTEVWNGGKPDAGISFGVTDVGLDPLNPGTVYVSAFDAGAWRRDAGAGSTAFQQVFAPQFDQGGNLNAGIDRTMLALTVKNGHTRIYLTDGTAAGGGDRKSTRLNSSHP